MTISELVLNRDSKTLYQEFIPNNWDRNYLTSDLLSYWSLIRLSFPITGGKWALTLFPLPSGLGACVRRGTDSMSLRPGRSVALLKARAKFITSFSTQLSFNTFSSHCMWICCDFLNHLRALFPPPLTLALQENALLLNCTPEASRYHH